MRQKEAADDAFMNNVKSACIMKATKVWIGFSQAGE